MAADYRISRMSWAVLLFGLQLAQAFYIPGEQWHYNGQHDMLLIGGRFLDKVVRRR